MLDPPVEPSTAQWCAVMGTFYAVSPQPFTVVLHHRSVRARASRRSIRLLWCRAQFRTHESCRDSQAAHEPAIDGRGSHAARSRCAVQQQRGRRVDQPAECSPGEGGCRVSGCWRSWMSARLPPPRLADRRRLCASAPAVAEASRGSRARPVCPSFPASQNGRRHPG